MTDILKNRVPAAKWMNHPELWDKAEFVRETSDYIFDVYGIASDQDKHSLAILADYMDTYVKCTEDIDANGITTDFPNGTRGPNAYIPIRNKTVGVIVQLMNELGLTPKAKLSGAKAKNDSSINKMLKGPLG